MDNFVFLIIPLCIIVIVGLMSEVHKYRVKEKLFELAKACLSEDIDCYSHFPTYELCDLSSRMIKEEEYRISREEYSLATKIIASLKKHLINLYFTDSLSWDIQKGKDIYSHDKVLFLFYDYLLKNEGKLSIDGDSICDYAQGILTPIGKVYFKLEYLLGVLCSSEKVLQPYIHEYELNRLRKILITGVVTSKAYISFGAVGCLFFCVIRNEKVFAIVLG